ncbi:uncharacterized protein [Paramormyrops kingsleyae]|uniref:uncharacterized protein n=1 Tax=Paramormyrops kingsleyae TaxID=1676925 RepID=UPI003B97402E
MTAGREKGPEGDKEGSEGPEDDEEGTLGQGRELGTEGNNEGGTTRLGNDEEGTRPEWGLEDDNEGTYPGGAVATDLQAHDAGEGTVHSLDHPLLKGFAAYLEKDLLNENFKQTVENVSRFMFFVNPEEPSLEFLREREKTKLFFRELTEAGLSRQTQVNYMKSLKRFLKYHTVATDLRCDNIALWNEAMFFVEYLGSLQQSSAKLVSKEMTQRR